MSQANLLLECDRLSQIVDAPQFERLRWARTEGPMLAKLVELTQGAIDGRSDFELAEEGASTDIKRFILKVHGNRIVAIVIRIEQRQPHLSVEAIGRSAYTVAPGDPITADFALVDESWMAATLQNLFSRIQS